MRTIMHVTVQSDARGRLLLPVELRELLGLDPKGVVAVEARDDGSVLLRDPAAERRRRLKNARGSLRDAAGSVDDLIAARRAEAAREQRT